MGSELLKSLQRFSSLEKAYGSSHQTVIFPLIQFHIVSREIFVETSIAELAVRSVLEITITLGVLELVATYAFDLGMSAGVSRENSS